MTPAVASAPDDMIRVMLVDDSAVVRGLVTRWLSEETGVAVIATHHTGRAAVNDIARAAPHVVVLDIEMPDMDGLTALPLLLKARPGVQIVMASTLTRRNADISLRCLSLGAADFLQKPGAEIVHAVEYRRDLIAKIRALGEAGRRRGAPTVARPARSFRIDAQRAAVAVPAAIDTRAFRADAASPQAPTLRPFSTTPVRAIAIGASTGGPQALSAVLRAIGPAIANIPVLVTQHMPATFTAALAEHLAAASGRPAREAPDGEVLQRGVIYVAPGGHHFSIAQRAQPTVKIEDGPPENFCKPSVDPMFRAAAAVYGSGLLAVMLTGMGSDGAGGVRAVSAAGGSIIAQDEASSVVWGMPGVAVATGCCSAVLPLSAIGPKIIRLIAGERT